jgi:hypothetical protein
MPRQGENAMKTLLCSVAFLAAAAPAEGEPRYDRNLEKAAIEIAASRMGELRGGFTFRQVPQLVISRAAPLVITMPVRGRLRKVSGDGDDGLAPAVERQVSRAES